MAVGRAWNSTPFCAKWRGMSSQSAIRLETSRWPLLAPGEPPPVRVVNDRATAPTLLVCDHAANRLPRALGDLGLPPGEIDRHIGWDIGAEAVTTRLADLLNAPAVMTSYSRLALDPNRQLNDPTLIVQESDGTVVPSNRGLAPADRQARLDSFFGPYHDAIAARLEAMRAAGPTPALVSIHSFTPVMRGFRRPWHVGVLWDEDGRIALPLLDAFRAEGDLVVGDNEPYSGRDGHGFTMRHHAEAQGLPGVMLEIRQDLIADDSGAEAWAERLARLLRPILASL